MKGAEVDFDFLRYQKIHEARLSAIFQKHDTDTLGSLSRDQLRSALREMGVSSFVLYDGSDLEKLISQVQQKQKIERVKKRKYREEENSATFWNKQYYRSVFPQIEKNRLTLSEFKALFEVSRVRKAFEAVDRDGDGAISLSELRNALHALGLHSITDTEARRMLNRIDLKRTGKIDFDEFFEAFEFVPMADLAYIGRRWTELSELSPMLADGDLCLPHGASSDLLIQPTDQEAHEASVMAQDLPQAVTALTLGQTITAGGIAGCCSRTVTAPLERMKLEAQTNSSIFDTYIEMRQIIRSEGYLGLFRGNLLNCLRVFPSGAISCTCFLNLLYVEPEAARGSSYDEVWRVASCCMATGVATTLTYPLDVLRTRWTVIGGLVDTTVFALLENIRRTEGLSSLFRGLAPALYSIIPWVAVQQYTLDLTRQAAVTQGGFSGLEAPLLIAIGAFSGIVAQTLIHPLEVVRRRMQLGSTGDSVTVAESVVPNQTWPALRHIVRNEGISSLYAGLTAHLLKCVPQAAIGYCVGLSLCDYFKRQNIQRASSTANSRISTRQNNASPPNVQQKSQKSTPFETARRRWNALFSTKGSESHFNRNSGIMLTAF